MYAYVILKTGFHESDELLQELRMAVRKDLGGFAAPDHILVREREREGGRKREREREREKRK